MSKSAQRKRSARDAKQVLFEHGKQQALIQKKYQCIDEWYPRSMAWRAGFLRAGGEPFWGGRWKK